MDLDAIAARAAEFAALQGAATEGPWRFQWQMSRRHNLLSPGPLVGKVYEQKDAALMSAARNTTLPADVLALARECEQLRSLNEGLAERVAKQSELLSRRVEKPLTLLDPDKELLEGFAP